MIKTKQENIMEKQTNFEIGKKFEDFVCNTIYPANQYDLISISPQYSNRFIQDCMNPDLRLRRKNATTEFWVECKFVSDLKKDYILFKKEQIERYKQLSEPLTYILGFGGTPENPKIVFSIPFQEVFHRMDIADLERYVFNIPLKIQKNSGEWTLRIQEASR